MIRACPRLRDATWPLSALLLSILAIAAGAGCRGGHVKGALSTDVVLQRWTDEGFDTKALHGVEPDAWSAGACAAGTVSGLEVLLCEYPSDQALSAGEQKIINDWRGDGVPTGASFHSLHTLVAITDRNGVDPSGQTIARLIALFRSLS